MPTTVDLAARAREVADGAVGGLDAARIATAVTDLDATGCRAMAEVIVPVLAADGRTADQVGVALGVVPRHRWLLRRWLGVLAERGVLAVGADGRYRTAAPAGEVFPGRAELAGICTDLGYSAALARYFRRSNERLAGLLRDELRAQELLFPDGDMQTAEAAYRENTINQYLNAGLAEVVRWVVDRLSADRDVVRVLELGAGIGGTTEAVVRALDGAPVEYRFTDVSDFFLAAARTHFADYPWMSFGTVDLNGDLGAEPRCDVILAANVLHNAQHVGTSLRALRDLLNPGGALVFLESCREHGQLLTSMHFLMSARPGARHPGLGDVRAGTDRIFLHEHEWLQGLAAAGLRPLVVLPDPGHPLHPFGQRVFAATRKD